MEIKARVFYKFYCSYTHRVQVSCTSSPSISLSDMQLMLHNIKMPNSVTNKFTAKAVPHVLSSVLTDAMQMLPSAVNSHTESNKHQYMLEKGCI